VPFVARAATRLDQGILKLFAQLPPKTTMRDLRRLVRHFEFVSNGRVLTSNLPDTWIDIFPDAERPNLEMVWRQVQKSTDLGALIEIETTPQDS
jgi:hypothetical protein